jgi:hypothetical protein
MTKTKHRPYASSKSPTDEQAVHTAIPADELVSVPLAREMDEDTFKLHLGLRHPSVHYTFFFHHDIDHRLNPDQMNHVHKTRR